MPEIEKSATTPSPLPSTTPAIADPIPAIGATVMLTHPLPYLKTADPRPMLRPPDLIDQGETGKVVAHQPLGQCAVRFRRGTFLIESRDLRELREPLREPQVEADG
ncbi:MAG: NAD(P)H dehydrogenase assembly family protein [Cyanobacteriota bacterium]